MKEYIGIGRRKTAVASVRLRTGGSGKIRVNGKEMNEYFPLMEQQEAILAPLVMFNVVGDYDLVVRVSGGGISGQMIAMRLGISRALVGQDEDKRGSLKEKGFLTRDPRKRERKKYGLAGARKRFQFSKR